MMGINKNSVTTKVRFFCSCATEIHFIVKQLKLLVNQNGAHLGFYKKQDVFWCVTQRVGIPPIHMYGKDIQYAHYSGV